jgi:hypothetical protein
MATVRNWGVIEKVIAHNGWGGPGEPPVMRIWEYGSGPDARWTLAFVQADEDHLLRRHPEATLIWENPALTEVNATYGIGFLSELPEGIEVPPRGEFLIPHFMPERDPDMRRLAQVDGVDFVNTSFGPMISIAPESLTRPESTHVSGGFAEFLRSNRLLLGNLVAAKPFNNIDEMFLQHKKHEDVALQQQDRSAWEADLEMYRALWMTRNALREIIPEAFLGDLAHSFSSEMYPLEPFAPDAGLPQELPEGNYHVLPSPLQHGQDFIGIKETGEAGQEALGSFLEKVRANPALRREFEAKLPETLFAAERQFHELDRDRKLYEQKFGEEWTRRAIDLYEALYGTAEAIDEVDASWLANRPAETFPLIYTSEPVRGSGDTDFGGRMLDPTQRQLEAHIEQARIDPQRRAELQEHVVWPLIRLLQPGGSKEGMIDEGLWGELGLNIFMVSRLRTTLEFIVKLYPELAQMPTEDVTQPAAGLPSGEFGPKTASHVLPHMLTQAEFEDLFGRIHEGHPEDEVFMRMVRTLEGRMRQHEDMAAQGTEEGVVVTFAGGSSGTIPYEEVRRGLHDLYEARIQMDLPPPHPRPDIDLPAGAALPGGPEAPALEPGAPAFTPTGPELPPGQILPELPGAAQQLPGGQILPELPEFPELEAGEETRELEGVWGY